MLYNIMVVRGCFESQASRLFVASCIAWYEQDRDTLDLSNHSAHQNWILHNDHHLWVLIKTPFSVQVYVIFAGEPRVLGIKVGELDIDWP